MSDSYAEWKRILNADAINTNTPISCQFELTARCNLDCKMCYVHNQDSNKLKDQELSTEQWKAIMDQAFDNGMMFANLTGGECLVRSDFKELYLHLWNKGVFITVLTNGILLNDDIVDMMKIHKPEKVRISIYGSTEEGYRNVTGHTGRDRAMNGVKMLRDAGVNVQVNVTGSSYIASDYINTLCYIKEQGFNPLLSELSLIPKRDDPESDQHYLKPDDVVSLALRRSEIFGKAYPPCAHLPKIGGDCIEPCSYGMNCNAGRSAVVICWNGQMIACPAVSSWTGPSVVEVSFEDAWKFTVEKAKEVVQPAECEGCAYKKVCPRCIAVRAKDLYCGHCNPDVCELTKRLVAAGVKKLDKPTQDDEDEFEH